MICKTCKHWDFDKNKELGLYKNHGLCMKILLEHEVIDQEEKPKAVILDCHEEWTALQTHMQFGCFLWEKIDNQ